MRIISCHIENFGKLSDVSFEFQEGLNVISQDNGWGKSTLATFLKVMFYGFSNDKKRDESENERKKYRPWQGGIYGGQLQFEINGEVYIIVRTFGKKEAEDTFLIKDKRTNLETKQFSSKVGEELFQIDSDSFMRTVYVSQNDCETYVTDGMNAKIGNLTDNTDDINNFEIVNTFLSSELNRLSPTRKTGELYARKDEMVGLEQSALRGAQIDKAVKDILKLKEEKQENLREIKSEIIALQEMSAKISKEKDIRARKQKYADLCEDFEKRKAEQETARKAFPGDLPDMQKLSDMMDTCADISVLQNTIKINELNDEETNNLKNFQCVFADGLPSDQDFLMMEDLIKDLSTARLEIAKKQMTSDEISRLLSYREKFVNGAPAQEQLDAISQSWSRRTEKKNTLTLTKATLNTLKSVDEASKKQYDSGKSSNLWLILLLAGVVFLILGIAGFAVNMAAGIVGVLIGVLLGVAGIVTLFSKSRTLPVMEENPEIQRLEEEINNSETFIRQTEEDVMDFCSRFEVEYDENNLQNILFSLKSDVRDYETLSEKEKSCEAGMAEKEYEAACHKVYSFLKEYLPDIVNVQEDSFGRYLNIIRMNVEKYGMLQSKYRNYQNATKDLEQKKNRVFDYLQSLSIPMETNFSLQLQRMKESLLEYNKTERELFRTRQAKEAFEAQYDDLSHLKQYMPTDNLPSLEELNEKQRSLSLLSEELQNSIRDYDRQLEKLEADSEQVAVDESRLHILQEEYAALLMKYKRINMVQQCLRTAKENFTAKYMSPILGSFEKYYDMLSNADAGKYQVDANFDFKVEQYGDEHELKLLSTGYRDLTGVCIRMAFIEAMYKKEVPFLLFDDPFVNLDKDKISGGMKLLHQICNEYQIIYFTCHESRHP